MSLRFEGTKFLISFSFPRLRTYKSVKFHLRLGTIPRKAVTSVEERSSHVIYTFILP